jgi:steroid delta-isomerase
MNKTLELRDWYKNLKSEDLDKLSLYYAEDVFFKDPFNEVIGRDKVKNVFAHMFKTLSNPHFIFIDVIEDDVSAFLTWDFIFQIKNKEYKIHGSSHLKYDDHNKINYHRDYWDVGEELIMKVPLLRNLYQIFSNKLTSN